MEWVKFRDDRSSRLQCRHQAPRVINLVHFHEYELTAVHYRNSIAASRFDVQKWIVRKKSAKKWIASVCLGTSMETRKKLFGESRPSESCVVIVNDSDRPTGGVQMYKWVRPWPALQWQDKTRSRGGLFLGHERCSRPSESLSKASRGFNRQLSPGRDRRCVV